MTRKHGFGLGLSLLALVLVLGAGCGKKTTTQNSQNSTNIPVTNSETNINTPTPLTNTEPNQTVQTISITDDGFVPDQLVIVVGVTVKWVNNSSRSSWPASDPHPAHTGLPGFDAGRGLGVGESYQFTFSSVGTFGFHDHILTSKQGKVIVQ